MKKQSSGSSEVDEVRQYSFVHWSCPAVMKIRKRAARSLGSVSVALEDLLQSVWCLEHTNQRVHLAIATWMPVIMKGFPVVTMISKKWLLALHVTCDQRFIFLAGARESNILWAPRIQAAPKCPGDRVSRDNPCHSWHSWSNQLSW